MGFYTAGKAIAKGIIKVIGGSIPVKPAAYSAKVGMFNRKIDAEEVKQKLDILGFYNEIKQDGAQWFVLVYSFTDKAKADAIAWVLNNQRYTIVKAM